MDQSTSYSSSSARFPTSTPTTNGCVHELRTLEDQLEAALASLTLTINDYTTTTNMDSPQQRSSGSSASSSGLGDDITNDSTNPSHTSTANYQTTVLTPPSVTTTVARTDVLLQSKIVPTNTADECDSAFSDSGSTDKVTSPNHGESVRITFSFIQFIVLKNLDTKEVKSASVSDRLSSYFIPM